MKHEKKINRQRRRRRFRVGNRVKHDSTRPRMSVVRSLKHICVQVIDDEEGRTLVSASTLEKDIRQTAGYGGNCKAAQVVGRLIAERALEAGVKQVAFDRRDCKYHGRVAALADAARDAGLDIGPKKIPPKPKPKQAKGKKKSSKSAKSAKKK